MNAVEDRRLRGLVEELHGTVDASLRLAFRHDGETDDVVHVSDAANAQYTDDELGERVKLLLLKGSATRPRSRRGTTSANSSPPCDASTR